jgi:hypothetical protein
MESLLVLQYLLSLDGVFADGDFVELEIFRHFICGHDLGQTRIPQRKAFFSSVNVWDGFFS